ncbi:MAG: HD domain-containing phosphohydrolase [Rhodospirillaceae bacterium]
MSKDRVALVAVVDGNIDHRVPMIMALKSLYRVARYETAATAERGFALEMPQVVVVDEYVPPLGGRSLIERMRTNDETATLPVIFTVSPENMHSSRPLEFLSADVTLIRPFGRSALVSAVTKMLNMGVEQSWEHLPPLQRAALVETCQVFNGLADFYETGKAVSLSEVNLSCQPLVEAVRNNDFRGILSGVRGHDNYSYAHSMRVATLLTLLAQTADFSVSDQLMLAGGGLLHDAGKMSIPYEILNKPGRLDPGERDVMQSHVVETMRLLRDSERIPKGIMIIAEQHHEKIDGSGYPKGLKGGQLNELARMASIVDIFSALTDRRVYKPPMPVEQVLVLMTEGMKDHIDQHMLNTFRHILLDLVVDS